jgi:hypothetical protein
MRQWREANPLKHRFAVLRDRAARKRVPFDFSSCAPLPPGFRASRTYWAQQRRAEGWAHNPEWRERDEEWLKYAEAP